MKVKKLTGRQLKLARQAKGMKQDEAAELLGISRGYLSQIETGKSIPNPELQRKIDNYFGDIVDDFFYIPKQ